MITEEVVLVKCHFSWAGVPVELTFHLDAPRGGDFAGVAPVEYCYGKDGVPLRGDMPRGQRIEGTIVGLALGPGEEEETERVYLPDGEIYEVDRDRIEKKGGPARVPLQS